LGQNPLGQIRGGEEEVMGSATLGKKKNEAHEGGIKRKGKEGLTAPERMKKRGLFQEKLNLQSTEKT